MGSSVSNLVGQYMCRKPYRVVIEGFYGTGKTTLLYRLKTGEFYENILSPTMSFNCETIHFKNCDIMLWDIGGGAKIEPLKRHYFDAAIAFIFVLDASDKENIAKAVERFNYLRNSGMGNIVLILANKQDLGSCLTEDEIIETFRLRERQSLRWCIKPASVKEWYGVTEGMEWLKNELCK